MINIKTLTIAIAATITFALIVEYSKKAITYIKQNLAKYSLEKEHINNIESYIKDDEDFQRKRNEIEKLVEKAVNEKIKLNEKRKVCIKDKVINEFMPSKTEYASMIHNEKYYNDYCEIDIPYEDIRLKRGERVTFELRNGTKYQGEFIGAKMSNSTYFGPYIAIEAGDEKDIYAVPVILIKEKSMKKVYSS